MKTISSLYLCRCHLQYPRRDCSYGRRFGKIFWHIDTAHYLLTTFVYKKFSINVLRFYYTANYACGQFTLILNACTLHERQINTWCRAQQTLLSLIVSRNILGPTPLFPKLIEYRKLKFGTFVGIWRYYGST